MPTAITFTVFGAALPTICTAQSVLAETHQNKQFTIRKIP